MTKRFFGRIAGPALLLLASCAAFSQDIGIEDAVKSEKIPASIAPADMADTYKAAEIKLVGAGSNYLDAMMPFMGISMRSGPGATGEQKMMMLMSLMDVSWTNGQTVRIALTSPDSTGARARETAEYLVTYKLDMGWMDLVKLGSNPEGETAKTTLKLVLVRTDQIASISPRPRFDKRALLSLDETVSDVETEFTKAKSAAVQAQALSNVKQMCLGMLMYTSDYDDVLPYVQSTAAARTLTMPYIKSAEVFKDPNPNGGEFRFNISIGGSNQSAIERPSETVLYFESNPWPDGRRIVGFVDGHAKLLSPDEWGRASTTLRLKIKKSAKPLPFSYGLKEDPLRRVETTLRSVPATPPRDAPAEAPGAHAETRSK